MLSCLASALKPENRLTFWIKNRIVHSYSHSLALIWFWLALGSFSFCMKINQSRSGYQQQSVLFKTQRPLKSLHGEAWQRLTLIKYKPTRRYFFPFLSISFGRASICGWGCRAQLLQNALAGICWITLFISHPAPLFLLPAWSLQDTCAALGTTSWVGKGGNSPSWGWEQHVGRSSRISCLSLLGTALPVTLSKGWFFPLEQPGSGSCPASCWMCQKPRSPLELMVWEAEGGVCSVPLVTWLGCWFQAWKASPRIF